MHQVLELNNMIMWIVQTQLYFSCTLRPLNAAVDRYNNSSEDITLDLVFFSAFEDLKATESESFTTLYVGKVEDILGRVPLFPCFPDGNITSTIPYKYAARQSR
jgi:hypothetical protein